MQHPPLSLRATARKAPNTLRLAILSATLLLGTPVLTGSALAQSASSTQQQSFSIPAGPLASVLNRFATEAGVVLSFDTALTAGRQSQGLNGRYSVAQGFAVLLAGAGLQAIGGADNSYVLVEAGPAESVELGATSITSSGLGMTTEETGSYTTREMQTATKLPLSIRETPQSVTVITSQRMADQQMRTIEDVVTSTPGLSVYKNGPGRPSFHARGFEVSSIMFDGLPTASSFYIVPTSGLEMYDRVEVVRGATGLMQGAGTPSAAINLVRKRPTHDTHVSLSGSVGSWDDYRSQLDASSALNDSGTLRARVVASYQDKGSFQDIGGNEWGLLYAIGELDLTPDTTLTVGAHKQKENNANSYGGLPVAADGSDLHLSRSTSLANDWEYWDKDTESAFIELEQRFDNGWKLKASAMTSRSEMEFLGSYLSRGTTSWDVVGSRYVYDFHQNSYDLLASGPFQAFGRTHELVVGASTRNAKRDTRGYQGDVLAANIDIHNWSNSSVAKPDIQPVDRYGEDIDQQGAYITSRFNPMDDLKVILGGRLDWYEYDDPNSDSHYKATHHLTRYAGAIYDLNAEHSVYASYTDIFQPQSEQDINLKTLDPIEGKNYEAGIKGEYFGGALNASAAVFMIDQENRAKRLDDQSACPIDTCYEAAGLVRSKGIDLEVSGALTENWQLAAGYTFTEAKYKKDSTAANVGKLFDTDTPRHLFKLSSTYHFTGQLEKLRVGGNLYRQNRIYNKGSDYLIEQKGYTLVDVMLGYRITESLDAQLNVNNMFDKRYYQSISSETRWGVTNVYGAPRNALMTFKYTF